MDAVLEDAFRTRLIRRMGNTFQHDLRSPLQGLGFCLDVMQKNVASMAEGDPAKAAMDKAVGLARRELARLERNARDLLTEAGIFEEDDLRFDLAQLAREIAQHFVTEAAMRGVGFTVSAPREALDVQGSRTRIGRAILVCVVDALDSAPDGGNVQIAVRTIDGRAAVEVSCAAQGVPPDGADPNSLYAIGERYTRKAIEASGGEFKPGDRTPGGDRSTCVHLPLAK
jgi:signal transduction histidine kinase